MPKHSFEFVVKGPPCTANNDNAKRKTDWKQEVGASAYKQWIAEGRSSDSLPITVVMEAYVTTYCRDVLYDVDNVLKWTLDGLNAKERPLAYNKKQREVADTYKNIYADDKLIYKITSERVEVDTWTRLTSTDVSKVVYEAIIKYSKLESLGEFTHIVIVWEESEA